MKSVKKVLAAVLLPAFGAMLVSIAVACTNPVADTLGASNWGLVGSWTNPAYNASYSLPKCNVLTMNEDGSFRSSIAGGGASSSGTYKVDSVSTSGGVRLYRIHFVWGMSYAYVLARTFGRNRGGTPSGNLCSIVSERDQPE